MILNKINLLHPEEIHTHQIGGVHYLMATATYFFHKMRLGDQTVMVTILQNIKRKLIEEYPDRFNQDNLYFMYIDVGVSFIDLNDVLQYAPHVFHPQTVDFPVEYVNKCNVAQVQARIHNWHVPMLYRRFNWTIDEEKYYPYLPLLPQGTRKFDNPEKKDCIILPVAGKDYHIERNQTYDMLLNVVNTIDKEYERIQIINKDNYKFDIDRLKLESNRDVTSIDDDQSQSDIVDLTTECCNLYVGGDCGFSHLVSVMYKSPLNQVIFQNTPYKRDGHQKKFRDRVINQPEHLKQLVGVDDQTFIDFRPQSIYNRNVTVQSNYDGQFLKFGFYGHVQSAL